MQLSDFATRAPTSLPVIHAQRTQFVPDIRLAPGGDNCTIIKQTVTEKELVIRVQAAATDKFTLYLEEASFRTENFTPFVPGGIHLDASKRTTETKLSVHVVKFHFSTVKIFDEPLLLLPALPCNLENRFLPGRINYECREVTSISRRIDQAYTIMMSNISKDMLVIVISHPYTTGKFILEHEKDTSTHSNGQVILNTELISIEDHNSEECTCVRKRNFISTVRFPIDGISERKITHIFLAGPSNSSSTGSLVPVNKSRLY